jgi:hypothetical protein
MSMTISQGLRRIKKLQGQVAELRTRAAASVSHKSNEEPAFSFGACVEQSVAFVSELTTLKTAIAGANATTKLEFEGTAIPLAWAVRMLSELKAEIAWLRGLDVKAQEHTIETTREFNYETSKHGTVETKWTCHLPQAKRAERIEALQNRFDKLNELVEQKNHVVTID